MARLRPVLAKLADRRSGAQRRPPRAPIGRLELEYLAAIMLDDLRNGRDLSASTSSAVTVPLPTWVTIAYNARQLVPVMVARQPDLDPVPRAWLAQRFSQFLFQQGLGSVLDMWGNEQGLAHPSEADFLGHLRLYVGTLSFGLACDVASAVGGLDDDSAASCAAPRHGAGRGPAPAGAGAGIAARAGRAGLGRTAGALAARGRSGAFWRAGAVRLRSAPCTRPKRLRLRWPKRVPRIFQHH
ncbi:hypothetical protein LP420_39315 [Massilia sp. B-10]|nr:hypothetical protein LP420_39315 [Massilia sp. B-10]